MTESDFFSNYLQFFFKIRTGIKQAVYLYSSRVKHEILKHYIDFNVDTNGHCDLKGRYYLIIDLKVTVAL